MKQMKLMNKKIKYKIVYIMKIKATISKLLTSSILLRTVFVLALFNIIGYLVYRNYHAVIFFFLVAGLIKYFSNNMILILGIPLFVVNLFVLGKVTKEGMENSKSNESSNESSSQDASSNMIKNAIKNKMNNDASNNDTSSSNNKKNEEPFEVGRNKKGKSDIDYASTIEDAYDELNNIIGGDGIKKLTGDTQNLMKQQLQLAEAMKSMGPLVEQMGPLMQSVGPMLEQAKGMMGTGSNNIADLAKNFTAGSKKQ
jgi:predicted membrane protein